MEIKTAIDLQQQQASQQQESNSPPKIALEQSPTQIQSSVLPSAIQPLLKNGVIAFATLATMPLALDQPKMHIRQLYVQPQLENQTEYPSIMQPPTTDRDIEVLSYLENLQSICYPQGPKAQSISIRTLIPPLISTKSSSISPTKKNQLASGQIDLEAFETLKSLSQQIAHYTITTNLGVKRYVSYLLCFEPQSLGVSGAASTSSTSNSIAPFSLSGQSSMSSSSSSTTFGSLPLSPQQGYADYSLLPFAYVIVQDQPAYDFAKKVLRGIYESTLLPYFNMLCLVDQSIFKSNSVAGGNYVQPLKIEFILSYLFKIINRPLEEVSLKSLTEFRDSGASLSYEENLATQGVEYFHRANVSLKQLLSKIQIPNIVQLLNCLLLQRKLILISRDTDNLPLIIEALLDILYPLSSTTIFMNISYLKQEIIDYIDSPVPYIIGISDQVWNRMFMKKWNEVSDDTVCFVIETSLFTTKVDLPNPPEPMNCILQQTLQDLLNKNFSLNDKELKLYIRQAFFNYILLLINDYRQYKINAKELEQLQQEQQQLLSQQNQEVGFYQREGGIIGLRQIFKFEAYLESQTNDNYEFYTQFIDTQLFNDFLERALRSPVPDQSLNYFNSCLQVLKSSNSFGDLLNFQQLAINSIQQELQTKHMSFNFSDLLESYERACSQYDRCLYVRSPASANFKHGSINSSDNGVFTFNPTFIQVNLYHEFQKQGCIKNLVKRPSTTKKTKPGKRSDKALSKHASNFATNQVEISQPQQQPSRNQSNSINNQQLIQSVYFQKGPQKVSTPKGLPSEIKSIGNFLSEDDSKSTNSKDQKGSQEETKSENSSFKSFFRFTFEKIQSKLKSNKAVDASQPLSQTGTPQKQVQLLFDVKKLNVMGLSGLSYQQRPQVNNSKVTDGPMSNSTLINQPYYMKNNINQKSIFASAFGPKSGPALGRPKAYSETSSNQIRGALQPQIASNVHYQVNFQNQEARPSAISTSIKSFHDSPTSAGFNHESFGSAMKVGTLEGSIVSNAGAGQGLMQSNTSATHTKSDSMFKMGQSRDTPISQTKSQGSSGQKMSTQQQLAYPVYNSGIVILKDVNKNTKKFVQKININLDPEDERNRRHNQRIQSSMQASQPQIQQSLSNSSLSGPANFNSTQKTLNSSRSGGAQGLINSINKTQISSGMDSPTDQSIYLSIKSSDKKTKNPSFKQPSMGLNKQGSGGRQKAISQNQPSQNSDTNLRKPSAFGSTHQSNPSVNLQLSTQHFKGYQTKPKVSMKIKRDSEITTSGTALKAISSQASSNTSSMIQTKKGLVGSLPMSMGTNSDKNTPSLPKQERPTIGAHSHFSGTHLNSDYLMTGGSHSQQQLQVKKSTTLNQKQLQSQDGQNTSYGQYQQLQEEGFEGGVQHRMRSVSYQMNNPDFQSQFRFKMKKDKSQKSLKNSNSGNIQSPNIAAAKDQVHQLKSKYFRSGQVTNKVSEQLQNLTLLQPKSQLQTFNEYTSTFQVAKKLSGLSANSGPGVRDSYDQPPIIMDPDLLDTPKMKYDGGGSFSAGGSASGTVNFDLSSSPQVVGQINPTIVRQDEQFGIYERNQKQNDDS